MESISMEAAANSDKTTVEVEPVKVLETRGDLTPEVNKAPVEQPSILDITKLSYELQQGYRVYIELLSDSYKNVTWPFYDPVDAEALGLWDYHDKIKKPMSFFQIGCKFNNYEYNTVTEVISDIRLILENCYRFNGPDHWVSKLGQKLEKILEQKLALLNRSLRDKVSLKATMALKRNYIAEDTTDGASRRRCAPRSSYLNMLNGENSSSLLTQLKIQDDLEERERRRIREREKKEANLVLLQDLAEWEENELSAEAIKQLHSMWEIPSLAGLLFLLKDILYLHDMSVAELELSFVYANKSQLLAKIHTALLLTPHQRKSLFKKPPMKFKVWESKLSERVSSWYKVVEKEGQEMACQLCGLDTAMFDVLGDVNPLLEKSYLELTLHQRVWMLKCLCDNSLVRDYDVREQLGSISPTDQREHLLGSDSDNWQYLYFPIFSAVDLRIYKQSPVAVQSISRKKKKAAPAPVKDEKTPARPATPVQTKRNSRLRKLKRTPSPEADSTPPPSPQQAPVAKNTISEGFEMIACDIEALKKLCEAFDEPPPPPKKRGRKPKAPPPRKRCEVELHQALSSLLEELEKHEASFSKLLSKAKIKIMKESMEPEPEDETEEVVPDEVGEEEWGSEESIGDEIEDAGAKNMSSDEDYVLEDEHGNRAPSPKSNAMKKNDGGIDTTSNAAAESSVPQKRKAGEVIAMKEDKALSSGPDVNDNDDSCSIAIQTAPPRLKKKRRKQPGATDDAVGERPQETAATEGKLAASTAAVPVNRIIHIPVCLKMVEKNKKPDRLSVNDVRGNEKTLIFRKAASNASLAGSSDARLHPSTNSNQSSSNSGQKRVTEGKSPLGVTQSSTASLTNTVSRLAASLPRSSLQTVPAVQRGVAVSSNSSSVQSSTVMFITSSGVPLKVLRTVPVSEGVVQVTTASPGKRTLPTSSPASSMSHPIVLTPAKSSTVSSSVPSTTVPSGSANPKILVSSASNLSFATAATPATPPVIVLQRPTSGGGLPLSSVKGGSLVVSAPSSSQQFVILKSPNPSLSFSGGTSLLPSTGISTVDSAQLVKTALGEKMTLSPGVSVTSSEETLKQVKPVTTSVAKSSSSVVVVNTTSSALKSSEVNTVKLHHVTSTGMSQSEDKPVLKTVASCSNSTTVLDARTVLASSGLLKLSESNATSSREHSSPSKKLKLDETVKGSNLDGEHPKDENSTNSNDAASVDLTCYETNVSDSAGFDEADEILPYKDIPLMTSSCPSKKRETEVRLHNGVSRSVAPVVPPESEHSAIEGTQNQPSGSLGVQSNSNGVTVDHTTP